MTVWPGVLWPSAWFLFHLLYRQACAIDPWPDYGLFILGVGRVPCNIIQMFFSISSSPPCDFASDVQTG